MMPGFVAGEATYRTRRAQIAVAIVVGLLTTTFALGVLLREKRLLAAPSAPVNVEPVQLAPGSEFCRRQLPLPADSAGLRLFVITHGQAMPHLRVTTAIAGVKHVDSVPAGPPKHGYVMVSFPRLASDAVATLCVEDYGPTAVGFGGVARETAEGSPLFAGRTRVAGDIAADPLLSRQSLLHAVPTIVRRAVIWTPRWVGQWTFYLCFVVGCVIAGIAVWLVLAQPGQGCERARGARWTPRRVLRSSVATLAVLAFVNGAVWAIIMPPWQGPDEIHHFEYVQYLAETGHLPGSSSSDSPTSSELRLAMENALTASILRNPSGKPPWTEAAYERWKAEDRKATPSRTDGGAGSSASSYSPLYYGLAGVGYRAERFGTIFDRLFGARLISAILGALTIVFVWLFAREVFGRSGWAPNAAAASAALLPQFGFMTGVVNNDILLACLASAELFLLARYLRRGPTFGTAAWIGITLALGFIAKPSMAAFGPATAGVLLWPVIRARDLRLLRYAAPAAGAFSVVGVVWLAIVASEGRNAVPANTSAPHPFLLGDYLSYLWHFYLPSVPGTTDKWFGDANPLYVVWMHSFFASFGWGETQFPEYFYRLISAVCIAGAVLLLIAAARHRRTIASWLPFAALGAAVIVPLLLLVHFTFYRLGGVGEQGRYLLSLVAVFGISVASTSYAVDARYRPVIATFWVAALGALNLLSYGVVLLRYYT